jgi:hypothetical protein
VVDPVKGGGGGWFMGCQGAWSFFQNFFRRHFWPLPLAVQTIYAIIKHIECSLGVAHAFQSLQVVLLPKHPSWRRTCCPPGSKGVPGAQVHAVQFEVPLFMSNGRHTLQKPIHRVDLWLYNIYMHCYNIYRHC